MRRIGLMGLMMVVAMVGRGADVGVSTVDLTQRVLVNRKVTLTADARQASVGTALVNFDEVSALTDTNGFCCFSNVVTGNYTLAIAGRPGTSYRIGVGTNEGFYWASALIGATNDMVVASPPWVGEVTSVDESVAVTRSGSVVDLSVVGGGGGITLGQATNAAQGVVALSNQVVQAAMLPLVSTNDSRAVMLSGDLRARSFGSGGAFFTNAATYGMNLVQTGAMVSLRFATNPASTDDTHIWWWPAHGEPGGEVGVTSRGNISLNPSGSVVNNSGDGGGIQLGTSDWINDRLWVQYNDRPTTTDDWIGQSKILEFRGRYRRPNNTAAWYSPFGFRLEGVDTNNNRSLLLYSKTPSVNIGFNGRVDGTNGVESGGVVHSRFTTNGYVLEPGVTFYGPLSTTGNVEAASMTLGGVTITEWPAGEGGGISGAVTNEQPSVRLGNVGLTNGVVSATNGMLVGQSITIANTNPAGALYVLRDNSGTGLDIASGQMWGLNLGADFNLTSRSQGTDKHMYVTGSPRYSSNGHNAILKYEAFANSTEIMIGGANSSLLNAATDVSIRTGVGTTNKIGTKVVNVNSNGLQVLSGVISGNASGATNLNASYLSSGTVSPARMGTNVVLTGSAVTGTNYSSGVTTYTVTDTVGSTTGITNGQSGAQLGGITLTNSWLMGSENFALYSDGVRAAMFSHQSGGITFDFPVVGDGAGVTNLNASYLSSGTVSPARMGTNVVLTGSAVSGTNHAGGVTTYTVTDNVGAGGGITEQTATNIAEHAVTNTGPYHRVFASNVVFASESYAPDGTNLIGFAVLDVAAGLSAATNARSLIVQGLGVDPATNAAHEAWLATNDLQVTSIALNGDNAFRVGGEDVLLNGGVMRFAASNNWVAIEAQEFRGNLRLGTNALITSEDGDGLTFSGATSTFENAVVAAAFDGSGAALTNLNASALASGTVAEARLPASLTRILVTNATTGVDVSITNGGWSAKTFTWGGPTNAINAEMRHRSYQSAGNWAVTGIVGVVSGRLFEPLLSVSNSSAGAITGWISAGLPLSTSTNALVIPAGKWGHISWGVMGGGFTNYATGVSQ